MRLRLGTRQWEDYVGRGALRLMTDTELDESWEPVSPRSMAAARSLAGSQQPDNDIRQIIAEAQSRWLRPVEVCKILRNYANDGLWLNRVPPVRPCSGTLFLFDRKTVRNFRMDGHNWRKKKDGKTVGEAHERLKIDSVDALHCYYARVEDNSNFQRRCYWMIDPALEHVVLVHYREVTEGGRFTMSDLQHSAGVDISTGFAGSLSPSEPLSGSIGHYPSRWPFSRNSCFSDFFLFLCIFLEPLSNILTSLIDQGRLLIDSLFELFRVHVFERYGHQAPSRRKWRVNSRELKTNRFLGQGFSGIIYETTWSGRENLGLLARKDFPAVNGDVFEYEAARLVGLEDHPNIVKSLCWTIDRRSCSLVMEYMRYDLYSVIQKRKGEQRKLAATANTFPPIKSVKSAITSPFDLLTSMKLILQISTGMMHLHDRGIAHGDLKPNNILFSSETSPMLVKVGDFGLNQTKRRSTTLVSHRARCLQIVKWKAPELFEDYLGSLSVDSDNFWTGSFIESDIGKMEMPRTLKWEDASNFGVSSHAGMRRADVYSFALTCSYIVGVQTWDPNLSWIELRKRILSGLRPQLPSGCPRSLSSLISSCWAADPILRPTFMSICKELQVIMSEQRLEGLLTLSPGDGSVNSLPGVIPKKPTDSEDEWNSRGNLEDRGSIWGSSHLWGTDDSDKDKGSDDDDDDDDLQALYKLLGIGSPAGLGIKASDWEAQQSPRSDFSAGSPLSLGLPARPIEREWKAHPVVKPVTSGAHENSPYKRSQHTSTGAKVSVVKKVEESLTPIFGYGSKEILPGFVRKKPSWSTWAKGEFLGSGTFGTVYEGVDSNGMFFAVKEVSLSKQGETGKQVIRQLEEEIAFLSAIQHPNIVQYLGTQRDDEKLYIFLELVSKGSLAHVYEKYVFFYEQVRAYTKQILNGLKYLHDLKIIHRDIKCANILVDASGVVKLADFGVAKQVDNLGLLKSFLSSAQWMAPEVVNPRRSYNLKADIWSLGCTVLEMAIGKPPFGDLETHGVLWKVGHGEGPPIPDDLAEDLKSFIANCLEVNVETRPTCDLLLTHPFITGAPMIGPVKLVVTPELLSTGEERSIDISEPTSTGANSNVAASSSMISNMMNQRFDRSRTTKKFSRIPRRSKICTSTSENMKL